jgi:ABC-type amino acid transport substrate-binding protein
VEPPVRSAPLRWAFIGAVLALLLLALDPARAADLPPDMARILGSGELRVAMHREDQPPFFSTGATGALDGLDVALAQDLAATLGLQVRFLRQADTFDGVVDAVARGEADVAVSVLSRTLPRAQRVRFTTPYAELHQALLLNRLRTAPLRLDEDPAAGLNRAGVRVGAVAGSAYVGFAREGFPAAETVVCDTWAAAVRDLLAGSLHAVLYDDVEVRAWQKANPDQSLYAKAVVLEGRRDPIAMAVQWRDTHWLAWLNLYLRTAADNGALGRLQRRYLHNETRRGPP